MIDILRGTPLWVYAVFFILSYYGVSACFRSHVSKRSLQISPVIFVALSLASLNPSQEIAIQLSVYTLGLLAGWLLALRFFSYNNVQCEGQHLVLPGTIKVLIVYWGFLPGVITKVTRRPCTRNWPMKCRRSRGAALGAGLINGLIVGRSFKLLRFFQV